MQEKTKFSIRHTTTSVFSSIRFISWLPRHMLGWQMLSQWVHRCIMRHYLKLIYIVFNIILIKRKPRTFTNLVSLLQDWDWLKKHKTVCQLLWKQIVTYCNNDLYSYISWSALISIVHNEIKHSDPRYCFWDPSSESYQ